MMTEDNNNIEDQEGEDNLGAEDQATSNDSSKQGGEETQQTSGEPQSSEKEEVPEPEVTLDYMVETSGIDYESLGVHLGLNGDDDRKKSYLKELNKTLQAAEQAIDRLAEKSATQHKTFGSNLKELNDGIMAQLVTYEQGINDSIKRLLGSASALSLVLKAKGVKESDASTIEAVILEMQAIMNDARSTLDGYQRKLAHQFRIDVLNEIRQDTEERQSKLKETFINAYHGINELEKGYTYGVSIRDYLCGAKGAKDTKQ